ncbi:bis(5'-nucleosyl)-tetraphosphatase PrpE [Saliterribacillus persicus]|uniref:Protein phosphatase/bis(5'-nucleosyl)-tetraphosphatase (Symmetrical) n=1 Tax=Saliterribacillus persicus TaxID=930114 RepID=A0A368XP11_9BACI|nr:bis(5'-nucleosyl)-tetraphosphatase PrpE [Saliterribacillus persicus]RCW69752.1 protein phosphatase/bis(5'-nucleosyl)-tetraphosphatase (symmetrical) [Saliterribacillus persicus]
MKVDIIGDVHGCYDELLELFTKLGYEWQNNTLAHPNNRIPVFVGDITDRGPKSIAMIDFVYKLVIESNAAYYVPGNHCNKVYRYFLGNKVKEQHGLETTVKEFLALSKKERKAIKDKFLELYEEAPLYLELSEVNAVIAHAGIKKEYIGQESKAVKTFVLYGDITGEKHEDGRPVRRDWAKHYTGEKWIIYGHTPVLEPRFINKTVNIDTGCVFGNKLTSFSLPEEKITQVSSKQPFVKEKFNPIT